MFNLNKLSFTHFLQPIVNLDNKKTVGYEFLIRSEQFENPNILFSQAKDHQKLIELDIKSISKVLEITKENIEYLNSSSIFINIFPSTLLNSSIHKLLHQFLSITDFDPSNVVLEICEFHNGIDLAKIKEATVSLKKMGISIALDDIGTGESTIKTLMEIEPNVAKVDRYLCEDLSKSTQKQQVINFLLRFLDKDIPMVLEGFESKEDLQTAKELGVSFGQGFFLGKPKPLNSYLNF